MNWAVIRTMKHENEAVMRAFSSGCGGTLLSPTEFLLREAEFSHVAFFGILRGCGEVYRFCKSNGRPFVYIDHAYFDACREYRKLNKGSWFRATLNGMQAGFRHRPPDRYEENFSHIRLKQTTPGRDLIYICPPSAHWSQFFGIDERKWTMTMNRKVRKVQQFKGYRIILRRDIRPMVLKTPILWDQVYAVITHNSGVATHALINGAISVHVTDPDHSASFLMKEFSGGFLSHIKNRDENVKSLMYNLAYSQFTISEFRDGTALNILMQPQEVMA